MIEFGIKNSGNQPILRDNFDEKLQIHFKPETLILSAQVTRVHPSRLTVSISHQVSSILIDPLLLNPGDYFVIQSLTSGKRPDCSEKARIAGISSLAPINTGWRVAPLPFFPFSHPMNGSSMMVWVALAMASGAYVFDNRSAAFVFLGMAALSAVLSLGLWFMGKRGLNGGRYIDEA